MPGLLASLCALLPLCETTHVQPGGPRQRAAGGEPFDQVVLRVRQEVALFSAQSAAARARDLDWLRGEGLRPRCADGAVDFAIRRVSLGFGVVAAPVADGRIGMTVPFADAGEAGAATRPRTAVLDYAYAPPPLDRRTAGPIAPAALVAPVMTGLRHGLLRSTMLLPCPANRPGGTQGRLLFAVRLERDADPAVGFHLGLIGTGGDADATPGATDTIAVSFTTAGGIPAPEPAVPHPPAAQPGEVYVPVPSRVPGQPPVVVRLPIPGIDAGGDPSMQAPPGVAMTPSGMAMTPSGVAIAPSGVAEPGSPADPGSSTSVDGR